LYQKALDAVLAVVAVYRQRRYYKARLSVVADVNVFYTYAERAHIEEP
jgi:hypothetical protein